jgi:Tfp pilus assembly protein PilO
MTLNEAIEQLKDLRQNKENFLKNKYTKEQIENAELNNNPFFKDMQAIDKILEILGLYALHNKEMKEMLNAAVNEMIKGRNCNPDKYLRKYGDEAKKLIKTNLDSI